MTTQKRAPIGGTTGVNGEFYEGGKFLPSTERPKRRGSAPKGTGKREIEPYVWVVPPVPGMRSLFQDIAGIYGRWNRDGLTFSFDCSEQTMRFYALDEAECRSRIERYNAGERWFTPDAK